MKIVICDSKFLGLAECMTFCGHNVVIWNQKKSIFDLFYEFKPELFIIDHKDINEVIGRCLKNYPQTRLVVNEGAYNRCDLSISENINSRYFFLPQAANVLRYPNPQLNELFMCDIGYIGKNHPMLNKFIGSNLHLKTFGDCQGSEYYCGYIRQELIGDLFKTANIMLHLHEGETSQQLFDIMYCEGFPVSDMTETTHKLVDSRIYFLRDTDLNASIIGNESIIALADNILTKSNRKFIFNKHTYFDRAIDLFQELGLPHSEFKQGKEHFKNEYFKDIS